MTHHRSNHLHVEDHKGQLMDRTVPNTGSEEIELYIRTYYSLLRTTADIQIRTMEEVHANMNSSLHLNARASEPDMSAFIYSSLRLPPCILDVDRVVLGQSEEVFVQKGIGDIRTWRLVLANARRRRTYYDGEGSMACFIASRSDIDDLLPILTAFQIEWNKLHRLLSSDQMRTFLSQFRGKEDLLILASGAGLKLDDLEQLQRVWDDQFWTFLSAIAKREKRFSIRLLAGSLNDYRRATLLWWENVEDLCRCSLNRPVYFVSSNNHSFANLISGYALQVESDLVDFVQESQQADLLEEWQAIQARNVPSSKENFLYYLLKKYLAMEEHAALDKARLRNEEEGGIQRIPGGHSFDIELQVIELAKIRFDQIDPRISRENLELLSASDAVILNIDYPLGMSAYLILTQLATRVKEIRGVYIMGKSAVLNGVIGDVLIPSVVHDEHSKNTYLFQNCFSAKDVASDLTYGTVLDNQKAVSVRGTFLQTPRYMDVFYREGYTDIEMEAGPYLSAIYELFRPKRHPENEIITLYGLPFDLGILHYASDTPLSKGKNLGAGSLSYYGMDPTYASSLAILRRIFHLELSSLRQGEPPP
ncbi:MAG: hypothetical protein A2Z14_13625 [Chloroflexi bacterium RBG_16_48_8]|nr:MAG: hypothetical protein A2Z14_13625 [Chloroflexi bacterium RBG_16_48_8]